MARKRTQALKAEVSATPTAEIGALGHNLPSGPPTDEVCTQALYAVQEQWRLKEIAKESYQESQGRYRASIKDAKAKGLNADSILDVIRVWQQDPDDIKQRWDDARRYAQLLGMPVGTQGEMFDQAYGAAPYELGKKKVDGRTRTGARSMNKLNPYPKGSWQAREFERGWREGAS